MAQTKPLLLFRLQMYCKAVSEIIEPAVVRSARCLAVSCKATLSQNSPPTTATPAYGNVAPQLYYVGPQQLQSGQPILPQQPGPAVVPGHAIPGTIMVGVYQLCLYLQECTPPDSDLFNTFGSREPSSFRPPPGHPTLPLTATCPLP